MSTGRSRTSVPEIVTASSRPAAFLVALVNEEYATRPSEPRMIPTAKAPNCKLADRPKARAATAVWQSAPHSLTLRADAHNSRCDHGAAGARLSAHR